MFSNEQIWSAIDSLALRNGLSTSRLSVVAGMDATALNKSKRTGVDGRPRWVSTETIAKILAVTRTSPQDFFDMVCGTRTQLAGRTLPRRRSAKAHILLVDPDAPFSDRMAAGLDAAGYDIDMAPDLRHALAVIESWPPLDVLITDLHLPYGALGRNLARIALTYQPRLKIIFVTGVVLPPSPATCAETILQKPLEAAHLGTVVASLLGDSGAAPAKSRPLHASDNKSNGKMLGSR
jgi:CheY-like chemotaxis protein